MVVIISEPLIEVDASSQDISVVGTEMPTVDVSITESATTVTVNQAGIQGPPGPAGSSVSQSEETPSGTIDGTNPTFMLSASPLSNSLFLFRNGLFQRRHASGDYTLSGSTITFLTGAIPTTGDTLVANFRT